MLIKYMKYALCIFFIMGPLMFFGVKGNVIGMTMGVVAGIFTSVFINPGAFVKPRDTESEGKLAEMKVIIEEARHEVDQLKGALKPLILGSIHTMTQLGRYSAIDDFYKKAEVIHGCKEVMQNFNIMSPELKTALDTFEQYTVWDAYNHVIKAILEEEVFVNHAFQINEKLMVKNYYQDADYPSVSLIKTAIENCGIKYDNIPYDVKEAIANYARRKNA